MFWILLFLLETSLLLRISESASNLCNSRSTACKCVLDSGDSIDLSSVGLHEFPKFYELVGPKNENYTDVDLYSYNPCYAFNYPDTHTSSANNAPCSDVAACRKSPGGPEGQLPYLHPLGLQADASFYHDGNHTYISYGYPGIPSKLTVNLECIGDGLHNLTVDAVDESGNINMTLSSTCACLNTCKPPSTTQESGNLSTGSVLLITFFAILLIYVAFGIVWNCCNGAKGIEILPNIEFWNDLPKLIMEGVSFTCSCFARRRTYGDI